MMTRTIRTTAVACALVGACVVGASSPAAAWLGQGPITRYPAEGGTWKYGFWDVKVRSYYTVNRNHGSTVILNGATSQSICTASGKTSIAEKWAVNWWGAQDAYYYRVC